MKDKLKIFAEEHRDSFENYQIDVDETWIGLEQRLNDLERKPFRTIWRNALKVAAVLFVVITVAYGSYLNKERIDLNKNGIALHDISSDLADTEAFYASQIDEKLKLIEISAGNIDPEIKKQLEILDMDYKSLKNDLLDNADSEEVINAMIEFYRLKLAMLEKILKEIQKNDDTKDHEEVQAI